MNTWHKYDTYTYALLVMPAITGLSRYNTRREAAQAEMRAGLFRKSLQWAAQSGAAFVGAIGGAGRRIEAGRSIAGSPVARQARHKRR
jgi:hypothetical protein